MGECAAEAIEAWVALSRAHDLLAGRLDTALRNEIGMSLAEHDVLVELLVAGGMLQMGDVARTLVISKSGVTRLVGKLEDDGLMERVTFPQDRRATFARLTAKGRAALEVSQKLFSRVLADTFSSNLSAADVRNLSGALGKLLDAHGWTRPEQCLQSLRDQQPVNR